MTGPLIPLPEPPVAAAIQTVQHFHQIARTDPYAWLAERDNPAVLAHLIAENHYAEAVMAPAALPPAVLEAEFRARLPAGEQQVPVACGPYLYFIDQPPTGSLRHCRRPVVGGPVEVMLDEAELKPASVLSALVSPDHRHLLIAVDGQGDERCTVEVRDLAGQRFLPLTISAAAANIAWYDDHSFLYLALDPANRPCRLIRCHLDGREERLFVEDDPARHLALRRAESGAFIFLSSMTAGTSEVLWLPTDDPQARPQLLISRQAGCWAYATHWAGQFVVLTNQGADLFRLLTLPAAVTAPAIAGAPVLLAEQPGVELRHIEAFADHLVIHEREGGIPHIRVIDRDGRGRRIDLPAAIRCLHCGDNREYHGAVLRFGYETPVIPYRVYDYHLADHRLELRHQSRDGQSGDGVAVERLTVQAADGTLIPLTLIDPNPGTTGPRSLVLTAYGSYGASLEPEFSSLRLSLLERGIAFAIAHVRGGGEGGPDWHRQGQGRLKVKAVEDFIACADHLAGLGFIRLGAIGHSAGGFLVTAALNRRPARFQAVVGDVPFVDLIGTLADDRLPFTLFDRGEWGNPHDPDDYAALAAIAPYDTVRPAAYPPVLLTAGWHDPRVGYWEPAKLAQRLRAAQQAGAPILLRTRLDHGHAVGDHDQAIGEWAFIYAFLLAFLG